MSIKDRVLTTLKTSYAKYGFKKEELNSLSDIISANLTDESSDDDVTKAVTDSEGWARMMQTVYNRGVSETSKKFEGYIPKPEPKPEPKPAPEPEPKPQPPVLTAEAIQKMISEGIAAGLKPYQEREEKVRLNNLLQGHEKLKNIPKSFRERYNLDKEEDLDSTVERIETEYTALKQEMASAGIFTPAPSASFPGSDTDDFSEMMKGFSERNKPEPAPTK